MRRLGFVVAFATCAHGCGARDGSTAIALPIPNATEAPPDDVTAVAKLEELPTAAPTGATAADAAIVWVADATAPLGIKSMWIETASTRPHAAAWVAATRPEPVAVVGERLVAIRAPTERVALDGCDECDTCEGLDADVPRAVAADLGSPRSTPIVETSVMGKSSDFAARIDVHGLYGDVVFIGSHTSEMPCGATHPFFADEEVAFDLGTARAADLAPSKTELAEARREAEAALADARADCGVPGENDSATIYATRCAPPT